MMHDTLYRWPETSTLTVALASVFSANVSITDRQPNNYASIFLSEIVTCRLDDGRELRLLCKSGIVKNLEGRGHPGRVAYEATVNREVLQPCGVSTPTYYGTFQDANDETWLVQEYLDESVSIKKAPDQAEAISLAASWIGRFHADQERRIGSGATPPLDRLDADHYRDCVRKTARFAEGLQSELPWLDLACHGFERQIVDLLIDQPVTVIHGDYFTDNILFRGGVVYPIDWEWAALGPGEIDIACLVERWPTESVRRWEDEYRQARWPEGSPQSFPRLLDAVRLYLCFRYLAMAPDRIRDPKRRWRLDTIHSIASRFELI
jgi:hypothetical protein